MNKLNTVIGICYVNADGARVSEINDMIIMHINPVLTLIVKGSQ